MALKTDFKDDIFEGNRKYKLSQDGEGNTEIQDVTAYSQEGDLFTAEHINATNKAVNGLSEDMASLKKSVSDGKTLVAAAITAKKVATAATASFAEMAENIKKIVLGSGTARAADVLAGKTFTNNDGVEYTGTMPERGTWNGSLGTSGSITIPAGHHSGQGKVSAATQTALTLNPGTTQKTAYVYQKYMLGNITVPAINIPAAYIKKGQQITFPDGSSVVGTFEGWVPVATDLYYNGANANGFTIYGTYARLENNRIYFIKTSSASPINSTYKDPNNDYGAFLRFGKTVDVRSYTKMIFEGFFYGSTSAGKSNFAIFDSSGTIRYKESDESGNIVPQKQIVIDITQSSYINAGSYMKFGGRDGGYITRIRLE